MGTELLFLNAGGSRCEFTLPGFISGGACLRREEDVVTFIELMKPDQLMGPHGNRGDHSLASNDVAGQNKAEWLVIRSRYGPIQRRDNQIAFWELAVTPKE